MHDGIYHLTARPRLPLLFYLFVIGIAVRLMRLIRKLFKHPMCRTSALLFTIVLVIGNYCCAMMMTKETKSIYVYAIYGVQYYCAILCEYKQTDILTKLVVNLQY